MSLVFCTVNVSIDAFCDTEAQKLFSFIPSKTLLFVKIKCDVAVSCVQPKTVYFNHSRCNLWRYL